MSEPDVIVADHNTKKGSPYYISKLRRTFTTRDGLVGNYDYAYLFKPSLPFTKSANVAPPFFGLNDKMPVVLALLLGFQHALAMVAGVVTPSLILSYGINLSSELRQYLVSTSLTVSGLLTCIQVTRFHIRKTPYYIGTGLISVMGTTFAIITVASGAFDQMYANGFCSIDSNGNKLSCPKAYGALIGTAACCAFLEMGLAFLPPKVLHKIFPPIVTGPAVMLIGVSLIQTGFMSWAGGSGPCSDANPTAFYAKCPDIEAVHALPWGSSEYIGLGFSVFVTILIMERFGSPIMKSASVIIGLLVGCIIAAACGYFDKSTIDEAPAVTFIWVHTFPLSVYGPLVLPMLIIYVICACEAVGDITATCDVSNLEVEGAVYESRIQGGILADGINGLLAALMTITPMTTYAQNNGVIALTRCANRKAGYCCAMFLMIMGIFAKFAAALVSIPSSVLGGMTTFLFCSIAVSGMAIVSRVPFNRRNRFILTASLAMGYGATLVPTWFSRVFTYDGSDTSLRGFLDAIELVMTTGFAITAFVAMFLNLVLGEEIEAQARQLEGRNTPAEGDSAGTVSNSKVAGVDVSEKLSA